MNNAEIMCLMDVIILSLIENKRLTNEENDKIIILFLHRYSSMDLRLLSIILFHKMIVF